MKRTLLLLLAFVALAAQAQELTDTLRTTIEGKNMSFPKLYEDSDVVTYASYEPFEEKQKRYIYREYVFWRNKEHDCFTCDTSSYFILSRKNPNHMKNVEEMGSRKWFLKDKVMPSATLLEELLGQKIKEDFIIDPGFPTKNLPQLWYPLVKYNDTYYYSEDECFIYEFFGNLLIEYGLEVCYHTIQDFQKQKGGGWSFKVNKYSEWEDDCKVTIIPCQKLKGAYIVERTNPDDTSTKSLWTNNKDIGNFDLIQWEGKHESDGFEHYETIDYDSL